MPLHTPYTTIADLPATIPLFPLAATVLFPRGDIPLNVFEPRYVDLIDDAMRGNRLLGIIQPKADTKEKSDRPELENVGCLGRITALQETGERRYIISITGICRFHREEELIVDTPYRQVKVRWTEFADDLIAHTGETEVNRQKVLVTLKNFLKASGLEADWASIQRAPNEALVNALCMMSPYETREKQALLEAPNLQMRAEILIAITEMELAKGNAGDISVQ
jgi:Lon protease-like protein